MERTFLIWWYTKKDDACAGKRSTADRYSGTKAIMNSLMYENRASITLIDKKLTPGATANS